MRRDSARGASGVAYATRRRVDAQRLAVHTGHCYGYVNWQEQPQYFGVYMDLLQIAMNCPSGCGGFINNEVWLVDNQTPACASNQFGACWVEAGFHAFDGGGNPIYFWADARPLRSSTYNNHYLNQADFADFEHFMIIKDARNGAQGVFQVWIYNDSHSVFFHGTSTSNNMSAGKGQGLIYDG